MPADAGAVRLLGRSPTVAGMPSPAVPRSAPPAVVRAATAGVVVVALLVLAAFTVPHLVDWEVHTRAPRSTVDELLVPPLHGWFAPQWFGPGTLPALVLGLGGWWWGARWARVLPWRGLLLATYLLALGWCLSLALVDGPSGLSRVLGHPVEYLPTARAVDDVGLLLRELHDALGAGGGALAGLIKDDVWRRAWQAAFLFLVIHGWWRRATLRRELPSFARRAGFWLLFVALFTGGVLGEVLGERDLWRVLARPELSGAARHAVQQLLALAGHVLLASAVLEEWLQFRGRRRA